MADVDTLVIRDLHKRYRDHEALSGAALSVGAGEVVGLLGPNGAGKTTLMKSVLGLQRPTSGVIEVLGRPWHRTSLADVGSLVDTPALWPQLDAVGHLRVHCRLRGLPVDRGREVLAEVGLADVGRRKVSQFSLGMTWRLGLALALLPRPKLLLLDEPTNGLDPVGIKQFRALVRSLAAGGTAVLVSSHQLHEVAQVCDRVAVLVAGRTRYEGALQGLARDGDLEEAFFRIVENAHR